MVVWGCCGKSYGADRSAPFTKRFDDTVHPVHQAPLSAQDDRMAQIASLDQCEMRGDTARCCHISRFLEPPVLIKLGDVGKGDVMHG